jgi:predicted hydrocarbon binding protein
MTMKDNEAAQWIRVALSKISLLENEKGVSILEKCGRECAISHGFPDRARKIRDEIDDKNNIDLLFTQLKEKVYDNSPRLYKEGDVIYLEYHKCGCPLVNSGEVTHPFFCHCTRGYTKERFEALFDKPVHVDVIESILRGNKICKQAITIAEE